MIIHKVLLQKTDLKFFLTLSMDNEPNHECVHFHTVAAQVASAVSWSASYLVCSHPGDDGQNEILGRSARHCTWSVGWVGGLHGTAAPRGLCWTADTNTRRFLKTIWKHDDITHELQLHFSSFNVAPFPVTWCGDWYSTHCAWSIV